MWLHEIEICLIAVSFLLLRGAFVFPGVIGNVIHQSGAEMAKKSKYEKTQQARN
jgi:hypothetical protein